MVGLAVDASVGSVMGAFYVVSVMCTGRSEVLCVPHMQSERQI